LRLAHLSPDIPAVDVCLQESSSTSYTGPILRSFAGSSSTFSEGTVSLYVPVAAATYNVRLVWADAVDCTDASKLADLAGTFTVQTGAYSTLALEGLVVGSPALAFKNYVDASGTTVASGKALWRVVHAAPNVPSASDTSLDLGVEFSGNYFALFTGIAYSNFETVTPAATGITIDANGWATITPSPTGLATDIKATTSQSAVVSIPAQTTGFQVGSIYSQFIFVTGGATKVLTCDDVTTQAASGQVYSTACSVLP
jgi:hypothetical protein